MNVATARLVGATVLIGALAAGFAIGRASRKVQEQPTRLTITATNAIPEELERLQLSDTQREQLGPVLKRGRDRVLHIVDEFTPRMQTAVDSTDAEIRALLTVLQRVAFDSARRANPTLRRVIRGSGATRP